MATVNLHDIGDLVRIVGTLTTQAGALVDPTGLTCKVLSPAGTTATHVYGVNPFPVRDSSGVYHVDVTPDAAGEWYYKFTSTGTGQAMDEGYFVVRAGVV